MTNWKALFKKLPQTKQNIYLFKINRKNYKYFHPRGGTGRNVIIFEVDMSLSK